MNRRPSLLWSLGCALAILAPGDAANAQSREKIHWPWERPAYRSAPRERTAPSTRTTPRQEAEPSYQSAPSSSSVSSSSSQGPSSPDNYRSSSGSQSNDGTRSSGSAETYRVIPQVAPSQVMPTSLQPAVQQRQSAPREDVSEPAQAMAGARTPVPNSAQYVQQATACMNEKKSIAPDVVVKNCDSVIDETIRNLANAYYFRGGATLAQRDYDGAIASYSQAIKLDPMQSEYLTGRAAAYEGKNDVNRAMADYNEAIKIDPKSVYAFSNRGAAFQRKGDYARAAADYGEVTRMQPNNLDAWSARCWVRAVSPGQTQQALTDCNQALKIKADAPDVLDTRGFIYLKLGQSDNAIKDYDAALRIDPKQAGSLYGRGMAKIKKGDRDGGNADVASAKALKPDIADEFTRYGIR